jgi:uncharacterized protein
VKFDQDKILSRIEELASNTESSTKVLFKKLKKKKPKNLDEIVHQIHNEVWEEVDCLTCANCCKTLGPRLTNLDIERMGKALKLKTNQVIEKYLRIDEDGDLVFKMMPCPFLLDDNYCLIYMARPKACREYPHTDRKKIIQVLNETAKNTFTCPAVFEVVERLKEKY